MLFHAIFFYIFSFIAIVSAVMVTVSKNTVHSVFFLILDFISISCLFIMIGAEFLGMIMLIVYVGAVAVLFLFVGRSIFRSLIWRFFSINAFPAYCLCKFDGHSSTGLFLGLDLALLTGNFFLSQLSVGNLAGSSGILF